MTLAFHITDEQAEHIAQIKNVDSNDDEAVCVALDEIIDEAK